MAKTIDTKKFAHDQLKEVSRYCQENRGSVTRLVEKLQKLGVTVPRTSVERWLRPDIKDFTEPGLGIGLMILNAFESLKKEPNDRNT